jgi:hypothetical protein
MTPTLSELAEIGSARPWPAERIERWPVERLIPYTNHARLHSEADIDKLAPPSAHGDGRCRRWLMRKETCWLASCVLLPRQSWG